MARTAEAGYENHGTGGRGLALVRTLCRDLTYNETGTQAEAVYVLSRPSR